MDYEKLYKEALERAKNLHKDAIDMDENIRAKQCEIIFPKLKESEDEKIRGAIIDHLKDYNLNEWAVWLEKQGEKPQGKSALEAIKEEKVDNANKVEPKDYSSIDPHFFKPVDKVGPKFHKGDWVIHQGTENIYQVVVVIDNQYQLKYGDNYTIQKCADVDRCARLWDITKDARDGDVIQLGEVTAIFKKFIGNGKCICYCSISEDGDFEIPIENGEDNIYGCTNAAPATKEQRDQLEEAMAYAGYRWKAETKELIKVPKLKEPTGVLKELIDEDKNHIDSLLQRLDGLCANMFVYTRFAISEDQDWLESLKERLNSNHNDTRRT